MVLSWYWYSLLVGHCSHTLLYFFIFFKMYTFKAYKVFKYTEHCEMIITVRLRNIHIPFFVCGENTEDLLFSKCEVLLTTITMLYIRSQKLIHFTWWKLSALWLPSIGRCWSKGRKSHLLFNLRNRVEETCT